MAPTSPKPSSSGSEETKLTVVEPLHEHDAVREEDIIEVERDGAAGDAAGDHTQEAMRKGHRRRPMPMSNHVPQPCHAAEDQIGKGLR